MVISNNNQVGEQIDIKIEKLRYELENLIEIKGSNFDNEILRTSRKLDEILSEYYKMQLAVKHNSSKDMDAP